MVRPGVPELLGRHVHTVWVLLQACGEGQVCRGFVPSFQCPPTSPGTFSISDEEGPSEESHSSEGLCQASGPPMLVQKEACGAGDRASGVAGGPWGLNMLPHPHGQPSKQGREGILMTGPGPDAWAPDWGLPHEMRPDR